MAVFHSGYIVALAYLQQAFTQIKLASNSLLISQTFNEAQHLQFEITPHFHFWHHRISVATMLIVQCVGERRCMSSSSGFFPVLEAWE